MPRFCSLAVLLLVAAAVRADDWPQWLGPNRDGSSPEKVAPWKEAPKVVWKQDVGAGHSSPIVAKGVVYLHTKAKTGDKEEVTAYNADDGKPIWSKTYDRAKFESQFGTGPRATPITDGKYLYTFGVTGILACWNVKDGEPVWQVDTLKEYEAKNLFFGASSSPLIEDDKIIVQVGGKGASVVAFDSKGKEAWKSQDDKASYASGIATGSGKARQVVFLTQAGLIGLNPGDGKLRWRVPFVDKLNESSTTPVVLGDLLLASSVTAGAIGVKAEQAGDGWTAKEAWKNPALSCYFSTPVLVGDHLYLVSGSVLPPSCTLRCVDPKTGKEMWKKDKIAKYHAALMRTGDDKLLMLDDGGNVTLLEPNGKEYKQLAQSKVCGPTWAHPALVKGRLYLRDDKNVLMCLEFGK